MMTGLPRQSFSICLLIIGLCLSSHAHADGKKGDKDNNRKGGPSKLDIANGIRAAKAGIADANQTKQDARRTAAEAVAESEAARRDVADAIAPYKLLEKQVDEAARELQQLEEAIIESAEEGSHLYVTRGELRDAEEKYEAVRQRVFSSPEYQAAYQQALASPQKATELPRVRAEFIENNQELQESISALARSRQAFDAARGEALHADENWKSSLDSVRTARESLQGAINALKIGQLSKASANSVYRNATALAAAATARAKANQVLINRLQAQQKQSKQGNSKNNNRK